MIELKLPRMVSEGMVLQQKQKCHIWGWDVPGRKITVSFLEDNYEAFADEKGRWQVYLKELLPGGPHVMRVSDDAGNKLVVENILVRDVWFCSGQSNMELPMERVRDTFPEEIADCKNSDIRTFKIEEHVDFHAPL